MWERVRQRPLSLPGPLAIVVVLEDLLERHSKYVGDAKRCLERGRVLVAFDRDDGLPGEIDPVGELLLRHVECGAEVADIVANATH
jgi:hypothetical protein